MLFRRNTLQRNSIVRRLILLPLEARLRKYIVFLEERTSLFVIFLFFLFVEDRLRIVSLLNAFKIVLGLYPKYGGERKVIDWIQADTISLIMGRH